MNARAWFDMVEFGRRETVLRELIFYLKFVVMSIEHSITRHRSDREQSGRYLDVDWIREKETEIENNKQVVALLEKRADTFKTMYSESAALVFRLGKRSLHR
jgi:7,8-dihydro-6-hydroxymethylpterin-pyrophosphokinase